MRGGQRSSRLPDFVSVTLADILANGAAIVILLIVITVMVRREEARQQEEKVEEVSVLLSRDLATSAVMNSLPTSSPAMLHDYDRSPQDRHPLHAQMPILELHGEYVRNYYTGEQIGRKELLKENNALDRYLRSLAPWQAIRMRVDIYDIQLFYITMSILKDYGVYPGHWHFLGYGPGHKRPESKPFIARRPEILRPPPQIEEPAEPGTGEAPLELPEASIQLNPGDFQPYPYDPSFSDPAFGEPDSQALQPDSGQFGQGEQQPERGEYGDEFAQPAPGQRGGRAQPDRQSGRAGDSSAQRQEGAESADGPSVRFRSPTADDASGGAAGIPLDFTPDPVVLLRALFRYMARIQAEVDSGSAASLAQSSFLREIVALIRAVEAEHIDPADLAFYQQLADEINRIPLQTGRAVHTQQRQDDAVHPPALAVPVNRTVAAAVLIGDRHQPIREDLPGEVQISLQASLYPAIYRGLRISLLPEGLLLMPPEQRQPQEFRWRTVTAVNAQRNDYVTALVYAAISEDGELLLATEENSISLSGYRLSTVRPTVELRSEKWLLLLYGAVAALILLALLRRPFRRA